MENPKQLVAQRALEEIKPGDVVGLGTGTTASEFIKLLGRSGIGKKIVGVPTSLESENLARKFEIEIVDINEIDAIDVTVDGADEVDLQKNVLKGAGGALTREKIVAKFSKDYILIITREKIVPMVPHKFPIPLEVLPFSHGMIARELMKMGFYCQRRKDFITDNGNYILDCYLKDELKSKSLDSISRELKLIPGIIETGLFIGFRPRIFSFNEGLIEEL